MDEHRELNIAANGLVTSLGSSTEPVEELVAKLQSVALLAAASNSTDIEVWRQFTSRAQTIEDVLAEGRAALREVAARLGTSVPGPTL